jgi:hypothetical protein
LPIPTKMADLSITAASNSPLGSESPISTDDFHRAIQGILRTTNAKGSDIASATTTDIGAATAEFVDVTGTTTITGLGTIAAGIVRTLRFTGALTLTHNGTSLILPTGANITTAANDTAEFRSLGSGNWLCTQYKTQTGTAVSTSDVAYDATTWNGSLVAATKNALRDKFETYTDNLLVSGTGLVGYNTGAGGTVTQLTSKSTAVTLNKATGQVVTHNAALGAGIAVAFVLNNSLISTTDIVIANVLGAGGSYIAQTINIAAGGGAATIRLTNITAGSLGEAVTINFIVIKGVAA